MLTSVAGQQLPKKNARCSVKRTIIGMGKTSHMATNVVVLVGVFVVIRFLI